MRIDQVLYVGYIAPKLGWSMRLHQHDYHECIIVLTGKMTVNGQAASAGDILLYPAGIPHAERADKQIPVETIFFSFLGKAGTGIHSQRDQSGRCSILARWLLAEQRSSKSDRTKLDRFGRCIAAELSQEQPGYATDHYIRDIYQAIIESPAYPWDLAKLAARANLSPSHFSRQFKKITGRTPMQELQRLRIAAAADLLVSTNLPLRSIADQTGFANEFHFSRRFKNHHGISPSQFRQRR